MLKSGWRVVCQWTTALGVAATVIGILQQAGVIPAIVPAWVWWGIAIVLIFVTAVRLDMALAEQQKERAPESNMSLEDVVVRITDIPSTSHNDGQFGARISAAFDKIRELALQGHLTVFGRYNAVASDMERYPRELIPASFWRGQQIAYLEYLKSHHRGKTERCRSDASGICR
jgi:hypothetical protein